MGVCLRGVERAMPSGWRWQEEDVVEKAREAARNEVKREREEQRKKAEHAAARREAMQLEEAKIEAAMGMGDGGSP